MKVRVLAVTDLHARRHLYDQLADCVEKQKPQVLAVIGDFLDAIEPANAPGMLTTEECADRLSSLACDTVFTRGNHEDSNWVPFETQWQKTGKKLNALHGSAFRYGPLIAVGFPCWTGSDTYYNVGRELPDYAPDVWLRRLINAVGPASRTLWLCHEPCTPRLAEDFFWDATWREAVTDWQPKLVVSGHDHNMPFRTKQWYVRTKQTIAINCGQKVYPTPGKLQYCLIDLDFPGETPSLPTKIKFTRYG